MKKRILAILAYAPPTFPLGFFLASYLVYARQKKA
jgi:hypothetical protein